MLQTKKDFIESLIKKVPFFGCLSDEEFAELGEILVQKSFNKDMLIFMERDTQNYMYIVLSGRVKVLNIGPDGREHILAYHSTGDFFGEMALLDGKTSPATVIAAEDTVLSILSKKDFDSFILTKNKALRELIQVLCKRLRMAWKMQTLIAVPAARERIVMLLRIMAEYKGVKEKDGILITIRLTHQDIADYTGLSRETVSRNISRLVKERKISILNKQHIFLTPYFDKS